MRLVLRASPDPGEQYVEIDGLDGSRNIVAVEIRASAVGPPVAVVTYLCDEIEADGDYEIVHRCGLTEEDHGEG